MLASKSHNADSCHSMCIGINKIYILNPTAVVKLLQYNGSRVEHRDGFSSYKRVAVKSKMVNLVWILRFDENNGFW